MTHASLPGSKRHDTLAVVTGRSGRGTARQTIRIDETLWERFGGLVPGGNRSDVIREFIRWYVRDRESGRPVGMPKRPAADVAPGD